MESRLTYVAPAKWIPPTVEMPPTLVLWDVDGTLIDNGGVSREMYLRAFELITGEVPSVGPVTEGRTDFLILRDLPADNGVTRRSTRDSGSCAGSW